MRLVGVSMVRSEADIVETFVRHNCAVLDALIVVDHGSVDGTREILSALADEGLVLAIESESELAHLPVRSTTQLERKVTIGWLAHRAAHRANPDLAFHWRELYEAFAGAGPPSPSDVATIAANYGIAHAHWLPLRNIALVDDPLPPGEPSRYNHLVFADAAARVRAFGERLAQAS